ncbi:hypothetical protein GCM10009599_09810 [Luteococcus peritonei]
MLSLVLFRTLPGLSRLQLRGLVPCLLGSGFFAAYTAMTWKVFAPLDSGRFAEVVTESGRRRNPRMDTWLGLDAMSWVTSAALMALVCVIGVLLEPELSRSVPLLLLAVCLVVLAWFSMLVGTAVLLARLDVDHAALGFPGEARGRVFQDYVYVAAQLLATFATSVVEVLTTPARRAVTVVTVAALVYNTVVVALLVSGVLGLAG